MGKRTGEVSTGQAARLLEVHQQTVRDWARKAACGEPSRIHTVRIDAVGRYFLDRAEILSLRDTSNANGDRER